MVRFEICWVWVEDMDKKVSVFYTDHGQCMVEIKR